VLGDVVHKGYLLPGGETNNPEGHHRLHEIKVSDFNINEKRFQFVEDYPPGNVHAKFCLPGCPYINYRELDEEPFTPDDERQRVYREGTMFGIRNLFLRDCNLVALVPLQEYLYLA